jgi:hypothetical protein
MLNANGGVKRAPQKPLDAYSECDHLRAAAFTCASQPNANNPPGNLDKLQTAAMLFDVRHNLTFEQLSKLPDIERCIVIAHGNKAKRTHR